MLNQTITRYLGKENSAVDGTGPVICMIKLIVFNHLDS